MTALLVMLVFTAFVLPVVVPGGDTGEVIRDANFTLLLIAGVVSAAGRRVWTYAFALLAAAAIITRWMEWFVSTSLLSPIRQLATLLALVLLTAIVGKGVFAPGRVTVDRVMGAMVLYLLLGLAFAIAYESVFIHAPGAFAGALEGPDSLERWGYFSFVTLTTLGYGDITPVATFEAFIGQLYPAVILARLVSLQIAPQDKS